MQGVWVQRGVNGMSVKCDVCESDNTAVVTKAWLNDKYVFVVCEDCNHIRKYEEVSEWLRLKKVITLTALIVSV